MRQSILNKFILSYFIFALLGFVLLNYLTPDLLFGKLAGDSASELITITDKVANSVRSKAETL